MRITYENLLLKLTCQQDYFLTDFGYHDYAFLIPACSLLALKRFFLFKRGFLFLLVLGKGCAISSPETKVIR